MKYLTVLFLAILAIPFGALAQDVEPVAVPLSQTIFMWVGIAATVLGMLWAALKVVSGATPSKKDDEFVAKVEGKVIGLLEKLPDQLEQQIKDAFNGVKKD